MALVYDRCITTECMVYAIFMAYDNQGIASGVEVRVHVISLVRSTRCCCCRLGSIGDKGIRERVVGLRHYDNDIFLM